MAKKSGITKARLTRIFGTPEEREKRAAEKIREPQWLLKAKAKKHEKKTKRMKIAKKSRRINRRKK